MRWLPGEQRTVTRPDRHGCLKRMQTRPSSSRDRRFSDSCWGKARGVGAVLARWVSVGARAQEERHQVVDEGPVFERRDGLRGEGARQCAGMQRHEEESRRRLRV